LIEAEKGRLQQTKKTANSSAKYTFPVAGIGASAGGLEALKKLLENLPENTGLAFVIIQHLATGQESMLPEILSRSTKMPVQKVQSGMQIEPDNVYVIPSGKIMTINNGVLKLQPKGMSLRPIDEFLRSLASDRKTHAIGVVLSGTGTDGTEGLKVIKAEGGITFAQDPKSAQYPDMPKNAIAAETVYFVLTPEHIAEELSRIAKHPEIVRHEIEAIEPQAGNETNVQTIFTLLKASFGVNFAHYKKSTTNRRISRRIVLNKIENTKKYVTYLQTHQNELQALFDDLLIGVTGFFREPDTFEALREKVFPNLVEKKLPNQPIRVWIPGCSTGEEVYSVAMAIEEFLEEKNIIEVPIQIFGTDVNEKNVEKARRGIYLKNIEDNVSESRLKRFFTPVNGNYQVVKQIRDMCIFAKHDLTKDPHFSNLNLIVCRNLLIYFDSQLQERIIPVFHYGLKPNGCLVLGESESVGKFTYLFEPMTKRGVVFKKKMAQPNFELQMEAPIPYSTRKSVNHPEKADPMTLLKEEVDRLLMAEYVPAALVLNSNLDVLVFRGKVDPYISIDPGAASLNASKIVRRELRPGLQTAVYRAKKSKKDVKETVRLEQGKQTKTVNIQVKLLRTSKHEEPFFLVLFEETTKVTPSRQKTGSTTKKVEAESIKDQQIKELSEDLEATKQTLQTVIEQQEATNEELRSAMEEVQSSNEELMSANEELETAKEELQSTNEELTTLNDELKNRNQTLSLLNDDLANLMNNVDTAVVIVDNNHKIRRFTSSAQELLRLMPSDVDHPITDIRLGIPIEDFEKLLSKVTDLETVRQEMQTGKGRWYQMRIRPYLTQEKKIGGAVLSFADVTEIKKLENEKKFYTNNLEQQVQDQAGKLIASENLATIGKTAGMVGHDIRNPLQAIVNEIYLAKGELDDMPDSQAKKTLKESLNAIEESMFYINKIVGDLQDYAKPMTPQLEKVDAEKTVQEILASIPLPKEVQVSVLIEKGFPKLTVDASYLKRILSNLILNSIQAMPKGGKLTISGARQNGKASISIADTGEGIIEEVKNKIFMPLFTTKSKGQGFGLVVVERLTEALGGTVTFESEKGNGAKFTLEFPMPH
jgi:two-component system CheB/CheR fusion protein